MSVRFAESALSRLEAYRRGPRTGSQLSGSRRLLAPTGPTVADYVCDQGPAVESSVGHRRHTELPLQPKLRGVNLGGWMVLLPWVTPSLFYQFEDQPPVGTAMDMFGFCRVLGPAEGNRQLREHWAAWVKEADLEQLIAQGVNTVRIPVGDWMWEPYPPFSGCTDGSLRELERVLRICDRIGLRVLIDMHGVRRSQNGFDNSGHAVNVTWQPDGQHFSHWPSRSAGWQGAFDPLTLTYTSISWDNIRGTVQLLQRVAVSLRGFASVIGVEALNEPWQFTPLDVLKAFYWDAYWAVRAASPHWLFVIHDSFRLEDWAGFMQGCSAVAIDTHVYQAWFDIRSQVRGGREGGVGGVGGWGGVGWGGVGWGGVGGGGGALVDVPARGRP